MKVEKHKGNISSAVNISILKFGVADSHIFYLWYIHSFAYIK